MDRAMSSPEPALEVRKLRKTFGPTVALGSVDLSIAAGSVHALLGENGAGKSTIVKILSGMVTPDSGELLYFGAPLALHSVRSALAAGIATAFQELTLCPDLTVAQNFLIPNQPRGFAGLVSRQRTEEIVATFLAGIGVDGIAPGALVHELDLASRQKIEIARAAYRSPKFLLLDEPTAALSGPDVEWLGALIGQMKARGVTILFISHRMPEVRRFCDYATVLRNGEAALHCDPNATSDDEIVQAIIGRSLATAFPPKIAPPARGEPILSATDLHTAGGLKGVSLDLHPGEILGVAALQGMGQQDLFESLFGAVPLTGGRIVLRGEEITLRSPRDAVDPRIGISLVPEERKTDGLFLEMAGKVNASLPVLGRYARAGLINSARETRDVRAMFDRLQVTNRAVYMPMRTFSGGNQQKVAIAKWLMTGSQVLLLLDPTRGVDVGTKHEIYMLMQEYAAAGGAVLFYSTEIEEIVHLSNRVLVIYAGRVVSELHEDRGEIDESHIMRAALGDASRRPATQAASA